MAKSKGRFLGEILGSDGKIEKSKTDAAITAGANLSLAADGTLTTTTLPLSGGTLTGNVNLGDNVKAQFGAGNDLEIYHDASASYIEEKGTGSLYIKGTQLRMQATDGTTYLEANDGGAVTLKHSGTTVFNTTSTGIDVTGTALAHKIEIGDGSGGGTSEILFSDNVSARGKILYDHSSNPETMLLQTTGTTAISIDNSQNVSMPNGNLDVTGSVTADGLTVDGSVEISSTTPTLRFFEADQTDEGTLLRSAGDSFQIAKMLDTGAADGIRFAIDQSLGDISFYEDTGTTPKLFWDASIERLGLGTTTPSGLVHLSQAGGADTMLVFENTSGTNPFQVGQGNDDSLRFYYNLSEKLRIKSDGSVGIGTTAPAEKLHVYTTGASRVEAESTTGFAAFKATNNSGSYGWYVDNSADKFHLYDFTDNANRITLDGAGNVGIGTTSPAVKLHVGSTSTSGTTTEEFRLQSGTSSGNGGTAIANLVTGNFGISGIYFGNNTTYSSQPAYLQYQRSSNVTTLKFDVNFSHNCIMNYMKI